MTSAPSYLVGKSDRPFRPAMQGLIPFRARAFRKVYERFRSAIRAESLEFSQILTRYAVGIIITLYAILESAFRAEASASVATVFLLLAVSWVIGAGLLIHLTISPEKHIARRVVSICADALALSLLIHYGERSAAIFFPVYLWVILGNGFRFGIHFMYVSMAANGLSFIVMVLHTPYWRQDWQFSGGLLLAIIAIPLYTSSLIKKLRFSMNQAKAASRAKTEFLSMISHELRTPLNAILGLAQVSKTAAATAQERENAAFTEIAASRLTRMLDTILRFQAVENGGGRVQERSFDVIDTLMEVESILAPLASKKKLKFAFRFRTALPKTLRSDPDIIQTVIINLVTNAIKYTRKGFVVVELALIGDEEMAKLCIDVHDSGPGIDPDLQTRIFDQFVRSVPSGVEDEGGVGLGLSLCKSLIGLLGGEIGCLSARGLGSTFWVEIPASYTECPQRLSTPSDHPPTIVPLGLDVPRHAAIRREFRFAEGSMAVAGPESAPSANAVFIADPAKVEPAAWTQFCAFLDGAPSPVPLIVIDPSNHANSEFSARATGIVESPEAITAELVRMLVDWHERHRARREAPKEAVACAKKTILVADDNQMNRDVAGKMLKLDGHTVLEAQTGDEALEQLLTNDVDVALLDVNMPDQDGIEVCKLYQSVVSSSSRAVIVGLTADISEETRTRCLAAGMSEVLSKPVSLEELRATLLRAGRNDQGAARALPQQQAQEEALVFDADRMQLLIELFGADAFRTNVLPAFESETREGLKQLKAELSNLRLEKAKQLLHAIKSSARTIGALRLAKSASALEGSTVIAADTPVYESIQQELDHFMVSCRKFLSQDSGSNIIDFKTGSERSRRRS